MNSVWKLAMLVSVAVCIGAWPGIAAAESEEAGQELQSYFSNANTTGGQAFVNIIAPLEGNETATSPANPVGSLSILMDGSIRILATSPNATPPPPGDSIFPGENCDPSTSVCCDPTGTATGFSVSRNFGLGTELVAWASHIQGTQITESEFQANSPEYVGVGSGEEILPDPITLPEACSDITQLGSGAGVCSCPFEFNSTSGPT
jgi:hypothetical protein